MQAIEDQDIEHVNPKIVSAALLTMGQFVSKKWARVPGRDWPVMRYEGLKKRLFESNDNEEAIGSIELVNRIHVPVAEDDWTVLSGDEPSPRAIHKWLGWYTMQHLPPHQLSNTSLCNAVM